MAKFRMTPEKELIIGLIVSDDFIKQIEPILQLPYLQASSSKTIANWCIEYYQKYKTAPHEIIQSIYEQRKSSLQEEDAEIIAKTLKHVSDIYAEKDKYNIPYMIDKSVMYIRERRIVLLQDALEHEVTVGNVDKAENLIAGYNKISRSTRTVSNLWTDRQTVSNIFNKEYADLFRMPGVLGELQGYFQRGNLYAYAGVAKRGKTRWLAQSAMIASMQGCRTLIIELEMNEEEISEILLNNMVRMPSYECTVDIPFFTEDNAIAYKSIDFRAYTEKDMRKWQETGAMMCAPFHRLVFNPNEARLEDIEEQILSLEYYEGFVPDVIFVDYADIVNGKGYDARDRVNNIWLGLKTWAKKYHCGVITATHMNGDALRKDADAFNVGEDKRKLNHVSGMYILNQTEEEKKAGIMRIKATATRFGEYTSLDEVVVLYNYKTGRTYIDSRWLADVHLE
jgi:hypothetical protein